MTYCSKCKVDRDDSCFYPSVLKGCAKPGRSKTAWCKECTKAYTRAKWAIDPLMRRKAWLQKYKLTVPGYEAKLASQNMACANPGCRATDKAFHIDHDHACCSKKFATCGECVRGILCSGCNQALGNVSDDANKLRGLIDYLSPRIFEPGLSAGLLQSEGIL